MGKLRIAFVDDDLDNFHANTFLKLARTDLAARGVEVSACWARRGERGRAWAAANGVAWVDDPAALDARCDAVCVLAPSDPGCHRELCEAVLPFGKPTYVDKTFAPDLATARELFALADRHGAPMQSASVLRYTEAQKVAAAIGPVRHVVAWMWSGSFGEYAIHPLELAVSILGPEAVAVTRRGDEQDAQLLVDFSGGRTAMIHLSNRDGTPMWAQLAGARCEHVAIDGATLFRDGFSAIIDFLASGVPAIDRRETLAIRAIMDAAEAPASRTAAVRLDQLKATAAR